MQKSQLHPKKCSLIQRNEYGTCGRQVWALPLQSLPLSHFYRSTPSVFAPDLTGTHCLEHPYSRMARMPEISALGSLSVLIHIVDLKLHLMCPCLRTFALASSSACLAPFPGHPHGSSLVSSCLVRCDLLRSSYLKLTFHSHPITLYSSSYLIFPHSIYLC